MTVSIDACVCPICGEPNQCAIELAKVSDTPIEECWCISVKISEETLSKVPHHLLNKACICNKFATKNLSI